MTYECKKKIFNEAISKRWLEMALTKRLESLHKKIAVNEPFSELRELKMLLAEAQELCKFRNQIAHGSFVLNGDMLMTEDRYSQLEIFTIGHTQKISEEYLMKKATRCLEISDGISRKIAILMMRKWLPTQYM